MKYRFSSLNTSLIIGMFFSLLIPIVIVLGYISFISQKHLYTEFEEFRQKATQSVAEALSTPIYYYSPNDGGLVLEFLKHDPRVVDIIVYDTFNDIEFLEVHIPKRKQGKLFTNREKIYKDKEEIGFISITFNDTLLNKRIKEQQLFFIKTFGFTFFVLFSVLIPLIYFKVLSPIKKLTIQAKQLQDRNLNEPFIWEGKDEINLLGQTFELARIDTLNHVNELKEMSETDRLTGLYNRHKTDKILIHEKKRALRFDSSFGIILIDVDDFKETNDTYGHQMGDVVLKEIATVLKNNSREIDTVGRWGGEEFIIISPQMNEDGLKVFSNKIVNLINSSTFEIDKSQSVSIGATLYRANEKVSETISRADQALYECKTSGKNRALITL